MIIKNLLRRKGRTILTVLGIGIGAAAIERVLGATPGSLPITDEQTLDAWFED